MTLQKKLNELNSLTKSYHLASVTAKLFSELAVEECEKRDALNKRIKTLKKEISDDRKK